jgi:hypothetical protein
LLYEMPKEAAMRSGGFDVPVTVLVGLGVPVEVTSAREAFELMNDWPRARRRIGHTARMSVCRVVMNGGGYAEQARTAFLGFAEDSGILVPALSELVVAKASTVPARKVAA